MGREGGRKGRARKDRSVDKCQTAGLSSEEASSTGVVAKRHRHQLRTAKSDCAEEVNQSQRPTTSSTLVTSITLSDRRAMGRCEYY